MIAGLDHIAIAVRDFDAASDGYRRLLGREPEIQNGGGARRAWFRMANMALEVISPDGAEHPVAEFVNETGEGLWLAALAVDDVGAAGKLMQRRGLAAEPAGEVFRVDSAGLRFLLMPAHETAESPVAGDGAILGLDHLVLHTPNAERAVANYAGRMGFDLRLDRENTAIGLRQLWFKIGDALIEGAARLGVPASDAADKFGGLAWQVADARAAQARIAAAGFNVSEVRKGRKPGTLVFTVRDAPGGIPTIMIQQGAEP